MDQKSTKYTLLEISNWVQKFNFKKLHKNFEFEFSRQNSKIIAFYFKNSNSQFRIFLKIEFSDTISNFLTV